MQSFEPRSTEIDILAIAAKRILGRGGVISEIEAYIAGFGDFGTVSAVFNQLAGGQRARIHEAAVREAQGRSFFRDLADSEVATTA